SCIISDSASSRRQAAQSLAGLSSWRSEGIGHLFQSLNSTGIWTLIPLKSCHVGAPAPRRHTEYCGSRKPLKVAPEVYFHAFPIPSPTGTTLTPVPELICVTPSLCRNDPL